MKTCVVGGGPAGLTIAWILSKLNHDVTLIDREASLGGCHRVRRVRVDGKDLFTEHGPRVYLSNFVNFWNVLKDMGHDHNKIFTKYKVNFPVGLKDAVNTFSLRELLILLVYFIVFMVNKDYFKKLSVEDMVDRYNFSEKTKLYLDKICRLTDGAGIDRYTAYEMFQLVNQGAFYNLLEPVKPNDELLFKLIEESLINNGVKIVKNAEVTKLFENGDKISGCQVGDKYFECDNMILSIPLFNIVKLLKNSGNKIEDSFLEINDLESYSKKVEYESYLPVTLYWNEYIEIPDIWGNGFGDWGIIWVDMTNYMDFGKNHPKTVLSTSIVMLNQKSSKTGKTANQTSDVEQLKQEAVRQVLEILKVPNPDYTVLSPGVYRQNNKWLTQDKAYILTPDYKPLKFQSNKYSNLFNVGTHNEQNNIGYTSLESATQNAIVFLNRYFKDSKKVIQIEKIYTLDKTFKILIITVLVVILIKNNKKY